MTQDRSCYLDCTFDQTKFLYTPIHMPDYGQSTIVLASLERIVLPRSVRFRQALEQIQDCCIQIAFFLRFIYFSFFLLFCFSFPRPFTHLQDPRGQTYRGKFITFEETKARSRALESTRMTRQNAVNSAPRKSQAFPRLILFEEGKTVVCFWSDRMCRRQVIGPSVLHTRKDFILPEEKKMILCSWFDRTCPRTIIFLTRMDLKGHESRNESP
jgi:hypothetical protein